jgi:hypothetical protein
MTLVRVLSICVVGVAGLACAQDVAPTAAPKLTAPPVLIASGEASLDFGGFLQTRYIANVRNDVGDSEEFTQGFSHRRARLSARGQINKQLGFFVSGEAATGTMTLFDGFASWQPNGSWLIKIGQFKQNFLREDVTFDTRQLAVEKSTVGTIFSQDRSQGLDAMWTGESTRFAAGLHDGFRTLNTDFTSGAESDYAVTASAEWKWSGEWKQFDDFTGFGKSLGQLGANQFVPILHLGKGALIRHHIRSERGGEESLARARQEIFPGRETGKDADPFPLAWEERVKSPIIFRKEKAHRKGRKRGALNEP